MAAVDETTLVNRMMPKWWKCPHCGQENRTGRQASDILLEHFKYLEHCGGCGYVHFWKLELTDDFKRAAMQMLDKMLKEANCGRNGQHD